MADQIARVQDAVDSLSEVLERMDFDPSVVSVAIRYLEYCSRCESVAGRTLSPEELAVKEESLACLKTHFVECEKARVEREERDLAWKKALETPPLSDTGRDDDN